MKSIFYILLFVTLPIISFAQTYLDENFEIILDKNNASYYKLEDSTISGKTVRTYFMNDTLFEIAHYSGKTNSLKFGKCYKYYKSGKLKDEMVYINDKLNGEHKGYYENGNLRRIDFYKDDSLVNGRCYTNTGKDTVYTAYQKNAQYKNGDINTFRKFVTSNLIYPDECKRYNITGKAIVQFWVDTLGNVVDVKALSMSHPLFSKAAIDVISKSGKWTPSYEEGKKVKQKFIIPVNFVLQN